MIIFGNVVYNITYLYFSLNRRCITLLKTKEILITRQARFHKSIFFLETTVNFFFWERKTVHKLALEPAIKSPSMIL